MKVNQNVASLCWLQNNKERHWVKQAVEMYSQRNSKDKEFQTIDAPYITLHYEP